MEVPGGRQDPIHRIGRVTAAIFGVIYFTFTLFPLLWMLLMALKSQDQLLTTTFIFKPTLENFRAILVGAQTTVVTGTFRTDFPRYFYNSLVMSSAAVAISILVGVPAAYALARFRFAGKEHLAFTFLSFRFAPEMMVIVPLSVIYQKLGLYNTKIGIIWVYQLITLPMIIWIMRGYFEDISADLEQAAMVDGYSWLQVFLKVLLPLVRPGLAAAALLAFVFAWNNFVFALLLGGSEVQTVTVTALNYLSSQQLQYNYMAAASLISALPQMILAVIIQRHLVRGLSFGAVKA